MPLPREPFSHYLARLKAAQRVAIERAHSNGIKGKDEEILHIAACAVNASDYTAHRLQKQEAPDATT